MKTLVTGGGGFLGSAIVRRLVERGDTVVSLSRNTYPSLDALSVEQISGSLADKSTVERAVSGCDVVYHVAAKAGIWGAYQEYYQTNVVGTGNVIDACRNHGVARLVHTSSPSVVFQGRDIEGGDESLPYATEFLTAYPKTKMLAERMVLEANSSSLATVALRPHLIWGPGDNHLVPRLLARARAGQLRQVGDGRNRVDSVYIDNAADAHVLAGEKLSADSNLAGRAYFISNGEPVPLWELVNRILAAGGIAPVKRAISAKAAYRIGAVLEKIHALFKLKGEPRMTRFVAKELATSHWFDISAAKRDFGYEPMVSIDEGLRRLKNFLNSEADGKEPVS